MQTMKTPISDKVGVMRVNDCCHKSSNTGVSIIGVEVVCINQEFTDSGACAIVFITGPLSSYRIMNGPPVTPSRASLWPTARVNV